MRVLTIDMSIDMSIDMTIDMTIDYCMTIDKSGIYSSLSWHKTAHLGSHFHI